MKRGTTRSLNKRLQKIEERLRGPMVHHIEVRLIETYGEDGPDKVQVLLLNPNTRQTEWIE